MVRKRFESSTRYRGEGDYTNRAMVERPGTKGGSELSPHGVECIARFMFGVGVMDAGDLDGDGDIDVVLAAAYPSSMRSEWEKASGGMSGADLLILRNTTRESKP